MAELLTPPDVEPAVVALLSVDPWHVGTEYVDHPEGSIRVSATGGPSPVDRVVTESTVLVECWHENEMDAWTVARTAWARLSAAIGETRAGVEFKHVSAAMPTNYQDVNRMAMSRYQFIATIYSRLTLLEA